MRRNEIKFIYFDIGGVFLEWDKAFSTAADKFKISMQDIIDTFDFYDEKITKGFIDPQEFWRICCKELNVNSAEDYNFLVSWVGDYEPISAVHKLAEELAVKFEIGIISNIYKGMFPLLLENGIIPDLPYKSVILSCDVQMRKPDKEVYHLAENKARVEPDEILFTDDSKSSIQAAKEMGWQTVLFETYDPERSIKEIKKKLNIYKVNSLLAP